MSRIIKFRDFELEKKEMRYFDLDSYDRYEHDCYGNIMQFTGLKDDNEVEIYDGDIIQFISGEKHSVEWNDDICQWQFSDGQPINNGETYSAYKIVIGNIYEHPELTKIQTT